MMEPPVAEKPTPIGSGLGLLAALCATTVTLGFSVPAAIASFFGLGLLLGGLLMPRPGLITGGAAVLGVGVLLAGLHGASGLLVGVGLVGVVVAWDVSHNALSHGRQVGRDAATALPEALHAAASAVVGMLAVAVGYGIYRATTAGQPSTAVALFTLGAVLIILAMK